MAEVFFDQKEVANSADIVRYRFRAEPVPGCRSVHSYTLWLNLEADPQQLLGKMSRNTRAQIRRARADGLRYEFASAPTESWAEQFFDFFDSFAKDRHLTPIYRPSFFALLRQNEVDLSRISSPDGRVLVWHAHLLCGKYACCLYSASLLRREANYRPAYIGRANRLHHWSDMLRFRAAGLSVYDFGGWYAGNEDEPLLRINRFKESFGGDRVLRYNSDHPTTLKGVVALRLRAAAHAISIGFESLGRDLLSESKQRSRINLPPARVRERAVPVRNR